MEATSYRARRSAMSDALTISNKLGHPGRYSDRQRDQDPSYVPTSQEHDVLVGGYEAAKSLYDTGRVVHPYHDVLRAAIRESKIRRAPGVQDAIIDKLAARACRACRTGKGRHSCGLAGLQDMLRIG